MALGPDIKLKIGSTAPSFTSPNGEGNKTSLKEHAGKWVVLYFYPRDNTPGCNKEACGFRDQHPNFSKLDGVVLGVSADTPKSHDKFTAKFSLPFVLVSDEDKKIVQKYGVWGPKKFMGRTFDGIHRATFLINPDGKIAFIWTKVKPGPHAEEVLEKIRELS